MTDIKQYEPLWGAWHVESLIGEGSYGKVYRLRREVFEKTYFSAVKLLSIPQNEAEIRHFRSEGMSENSLKSHFQVLVTDLVREIEIMSEFKGNSNIVSLEDYKVISKEDGMGYDILMRMELLTNLSDYVIENPLPHDEVVKLGIHICRALELFAMEKITHRDIKPGNIFISRFGDYKLGDFGVARQIERSSSGLTKKTGTETYMAPEVWSGFDYSSNVDMYSLGIVMYRFLNQNRTPFLPEPPKSVTPRDREEALKRRIRGEPIPAVKGLSDDLNEILQKACNFDRHARFASPTAMREALESLISKKARTPVSTPVQNIIKLKEAAYDDWTEMLENIETDIGAAKPIVMESDDRTEILFENKADKQMKAVNFNTAQTALPESDQDTIEVNMESRNINDAQLHRLVSNGDIPANVTHLNLADNQIKNITPLWNLRHLTELLLGSNQICEVSYLKNLVNLEMLFLSVNPILPGVINALQERLPDTQIEHGQAGIFSNLFSRVF